MNETNLTIGVLANRSGVGVETVRFYERKGILHQPSKNGGFRKYSTEDAKRIRFIKRAQGLGFTLREIKDLLKLNMSPNVTCSDVQKRTETKLKEVESKIEDLKKMRSSLKKLSEACGESRNAAKNCRMIDCFDPNCKC